MKTRPNRPERRGPGPWCARSVLGAQLWIAALAIGCSQDDPAEASGSSGSAGTGGLFGGVPMPPNSEGGDDGGGGVPGSEGGRCAAVPASSEPRIDNFEDGDDYPIVELGRLGAWHLPLLEGAEMLSFEVVPDGADQSDFGAHVTVSGFSERVGVSASLRFDQEGVACPYNASGYAGVAFFAKGGGNIELLLDTIDTWSTEFGGTCDPAAEQCWDKHRKLVPLTSDWEYHEVRWDLFSQAGWGKVMPFAADHLLGVEFAVTTGGLAAEFWIDEIRFVGP